MKTSFSKFEVALEILLVGVLLSGTSFGACGNYGKPKSMPQSWNGQTGSFEPVSDRPTDEPIVGMWHVTFTAEGNEGGPPDGTPIDNALVTWHRDGTEIMASDRPPQDGNFCMGVWEKTGQGKYKLNHIPWLNNDTTNAPGGIGNPTGPIRIFQEITLGPDCNHYTGRFTLDAYDISGSHIAHIAGVLKATRVTVNTTVPELL
jgi:hypothetical protein